jgi:hypothetical protein
MQMLLPQSFMAHDHARNFRPFAEDQLRIRLLLQFDQMPAT